MKIKLELELFLKVVSMCQIRTFNFLILLFLLAA